MSKRETIQNLRVKLAMKDLLIASQLRELQSYRADIDFLHDVMRQGLSAAPSASNAVTEAHRARIASLIEPAAKRMRESKL